jgi:hypothetical protein
VQLLVSRQSSASPPTHTPVEHLSSTVQALLSLQAVPFGSFACVHV